jgi:hypothetical protein
MSENPFTFGNPIRDPQRFYGRQDELRQGAKTGQISAILYRIPARHLRIHAMIDKDTG